MKHDRLPNRYLRMTAVLLLLLLGGASGLSIWPGHAAACSCAQTAKDAKAARDESVLVFSGKLLQKSTTVKLPAGTTEALTFDAAQIWKGSEQKTITVYHTGGSCGYPYKKGDEYLIYALGTADAPITNVCTRTVKMKDASQDLADLGSPLYDLSRFGMTWSRNTDHKSTISIWYIAMGLIIAVFTVYAVFAYRRRKRKV